MGCLLKVFLAISSLAMLAHCNPLPEFNTEQPKEQRSNSNSPTEDHESSVSKSEDSPKLIPAVLQLHTGEKLPVLLTEPVHYYDASSLIGSSADNQEKEELLAPAADTYEYTPLYRFSTYSGRRKRADYYYPGYFLSGFMESRDRFPTVA